MPKIQNYTLFNQQVLQNWEEDQKKTNSSRRYCRIGVQCLGKNRQIKLLKKQDSCWVKLVFTLKILFGVIKPGLKHVDQLKKSNETEKPPLKKRTTKKLLLKRLKQVEQEHKQTIKTLDDKAADLVEMLKAGVESSLQLLEKLKLDREAEQMKEQINAAIAQNDTAE